MDLGEDEKAVGEILRALLLPKMRSTMDGDLNNWHQMEQKLQAEEQIMWQLNTNPSDIEFLTQSTNSLQQMPVTYLTTNSGNVTFASGRTLMKPFTYVISQNIIEELPKCSLGNAQGGVNQPDPQRVISVQEDCVNVSKCETVHNQQQAEDFQLKDNHPDTEIRYNSSLYDCNVGNSLEELNAGCGGTSVNNLRTDKRTVKINKKKKLSDLGNPQKKAKRAVRVDATSLAKTKVEKKIATRKKAMKKKKKKKNPKLSGKLKSIGKTLAKKPLKASETNERIEMATEANLFELTKLEDNVEQVAERLKMGCDCADTNCFDGLNPDNVFKHRLNIADLTKAEHDMYLMGVIMASVQNLEETNRHKERIRIRSCYAYQGKKVCLTAFLYLQHVTLYQMKRLRGHLKNHGVSPRIHGNRGRKPANTFSLDIYHSATTFVQSYIEKNCVKSVPNFTTFSYSKSIKKPNKVKIANKITSYHLPSECTKKTVHKEYKSYCENLKPCQTAMKYSTFTSFLQKQFPYVKFHKVEKKHVDKGSRTDVDLRCPDDGRVKGHKARDVASDKYVQTSTIPYVTGRTVQPSTASKETLTQVCNGTQMVKNSTLQHAGSGHKNEIVMNYKLPDRVLTENSFYQTQSLSDIVQGMYTATVTVTDTATTTAEIAPHQIV